MENEDRLNTIFGLVISATQAHQKNATGDTPEDFIYDAAESVRRADIDRHVYVTYNGKEYGPVRESWGALDGDKKKSTVLIQTDDGKYRKLWYFDTEVTQ